MGVLYTLLKLQLVQGKILMFVRNIDQAYRMKIFLERFSINSAVLNAELPHATRQNIIQAFNQSLVELLIATDSGFRDDSLADDEGDARAELCEEDEAEEGDEDKPKKRKLKKKLKKKGAAAEAEEPELKKGKKRRKGENVDDEDEASEEEPADVPKAP